MARYSNSRPLQPSFAILLGKRTRVRFRNAPPVHQPQPFSVGVFFWRIAPVPACLRGFLQTPEDFTGLPSDPSFGTFLSLQALLLSGIAPHQAPEVRKHHKFTCYRSTSYKRTNQAVGLRHWLPGPIDRKGHTARREGPPERIGTCSSERTTVGILINMPSVGLVQPSPTRRNRGQVFLVRGRDLPTGAIGHRQVQIPGRRRVRQYSDW